MKQVFVSNRFILNLISLQGIKREKNISYKSNILGFNLLQYETESLKEKSTRPISESFLIYLQLNFR